MWLLASIIAAYNLLVFSGMSFSQKTILGSMYTILSLPLALEHVCTAVRNK